MTPGAAVPADPDTWHPARLIPTAGIRGQDEQEKRATSCLLAVMAAVPEFGKALLSEVGAPKTNNISTFTEVQLKDPDGKLSIPDGVAVVKRPSKTWRCLFEVKTSDMPLKSEQVVRYLDMAKQHNFDAVVTISNQLTPSPAHSPVTVSGMKTKKVALRHLSWWKVLTEAVVQHRFRGVADPDQAWILGELIAYLDHEASGAGGFRDMGDKWVAVRNAARSGTLNATDPGVREVVERWGQFVEYLCLGLSQDLGRDVRVKGSKPAEAGAKVLEKDSTLTATINVPDAVGPITVQAHLDRQRVTTSVPVDAPQQGGASKRIRWILKQLREAPDDLRVEVAFANVSGRRTVELKEAHEYPKQLLLPTDLKREPRSYTLSLQRKMGTKRGKGQDSFVTETRRQAVDFYRQVVQDLRRWQPSPPKLPEEPEEKPPEAPTAKPPPFSADEREVGEASDPATVVPETSRQ